MLCLSWAPGFKKPRPILLPFCQFYVYATCQAKVSINYQIKKKHLFGSIFFLSFFNKEAPSFWCNWWLTHWDLKKEIADLNCEIRSHFFCKKNLLYVKSFCPEIASHFGKLLKWQHGNWFELDKDASFVYGPFWSCMCSGLIAHI